MESSSFACAQSYAMQVESRSVSRILFPVLQDGAAIIHLAHLLPNGSSDLPGGRKQCREALLSGGQPCLTPPYLVLHYEEFAWPHVLPHAPVRSYIKPLKGPHRFTHHPLATFTLCSARPLSLAGLFSVALVVAHPRGLPAPRRGCLRGRTPRR